ncbi:glycosyltransferase family 8 protein [Biostraticola tofi]|uniref:UDP-glucose:(Glucosyl)LPS alpha-1,3-glucosyltransferase/UDP-glucose:(Galactosyl)LPS alpha-1,2-glucosyltransferase n=1 Tax=Biostraticola tofi TaxID=466109 RepID=A0A4V2W3V8_9GAMM|nr:glycosyltransferase [Biostraticola tofi]TCV93499.1 UDP-glucose:(glucosyl)LPS alpha-1,3-glucosyltransferase/UDP-glucose:(galactosyl)LPS alpha-1,2-glucosyltransferase [Biostraticola tofi]
MDSKHLTHMIERHETVVDTLQVAPEHVCHIAFGIDNTYARGMGITLFSLLENNPGISFHIHLFTTGLNDSNRKKLLTLTARRSIALSFHIYNSSYFDRMPSTGRYAKTIYYRLFMPLLLREMTSRFIYLDADILCVGSIEPLLALAFDDKTICAVNDNKHARNRLCSELNLASGNYFNSGFLYINIPQWLERNTTERLISTLEAKGDSFRFPDQDVLNLVLENEVRLLPKKYNFIYDIIAKKVNYRPDIPEDTVLIHFTGKCKPWHLWASSPLADLYYSYYQRTPWQTQPLDTPVRHKEMKRYAYVLWFQKRYSYSLLWLMKYIKNKFFHAGAAK